MPGILTKKCIKCTSILFDQDTLKCEELIREFTSRRLLICLKCMENILVKTFNTSFKRILCSKSVERCSNNLLVVMGSPKVLDIFNVGHSCVGEIALSKL